MLLIQTVPTVTVMTVTTLPVRSAELPGRAWQQTVGSPPVAQCIINIVTLVIMVSLWVAHYFPLRGHW